jgi:hypothetical protein
MEEEKNVFDCLDKSVLTLFNEPSLGLYYTQQHIQNSFPKLLYHMDNLYDNRIKMKNIMNEMDKTIRDLKEITSLNDPYAFEMLAKVNSMNYELLKK